MKKKNFDEKKSNLTSNEKTFYYQLHQAARSYNTKLWTIPGLFILVIGFMFKEIDFNFLMPSLSLKNLFLLIGGWFIVFMLLIQSLKDSFFQISIQKKINKFDKKMFGEIFPMYSATDIEITKRLQELKETFDCHRENVKFPIWRDCLTRFKESKIFFKITIFSLALISAGIFSITIKAIYSLK